MKTLSFGTIPTLQQFEKYFPVDGFPIECHANTKDFLILQSAINQGIDSYLEAVFCKHGKGVGGREKLVIQDAKSMRCLIRRLFEIDNVDDPDRNHDPAWSLATDILKYFNVRWV